MVLFRLIVSLDRGCKLQQADNPLEPGCLSIMTISITTRILCILLEYTRNTFYSKIQYIHHTSVHHTSCPITNYIMHSKT